MNTKSEKLFVLVREDKSLLQSYVVRCRFKQKAAAVRQAAYLMTEGYGDLTVMEIGDYKALGYDKLTRKVRNLMNGKEVVESINTPDCCSVASETYWSM
jgi:hypothetical protein